MKKTFYTLGFIVLISVAAGLYFLTFRFDGVVETRIERAATIALGSRVEVGGVKTNLRKGTLSVERISVANPAGFDNPYAVQLNAVEAAVDYEGLEIKQIVIENPEFFVEEKDGKTNFDQILKALDAEFQGSTGEPQTKQPVIVIRHLRIDETRAAFESETSDKYSDISIDAIEMNNLSGTPSELAHLIARKVVTEISSEVATEVSRTKTMKPVDDVQDKVTSKPKDISGDDEGDQPN
jgi:uncharacterized protein involved in outer membrane biogenesis